MKKNQKTWWAILRGSRGFFEKRVKIPIGGCGYIMRYPVKTKQTLYFEMNEGVAAVPNSTFETIDFEYTGRQETDTAVYCYYSERA